jgi:hypothetical protein
MTDKSSCPNEIIDRAMQRQKIKKSKAVQEPLLVDDNDAG